MGKNSDFAFQVNDNGEWCDALLAESEDANNKSFYYYKAGSGFVNTSGFVPKGDDPGHWREKP